MCGIVGFLSNNYNKEKLVNMTNALTHRGPDFGGYYFNKNKGIGLGHRRLSIIDISEKANQPLTSQCGRYEMVYNGEVYNFKELRKLIKLDKWNSSSDSEVILEAFAKWRINFLVKLNGMFSIAIYDKKEEKLILARDRMGIKPLFYYFKDNEIIFSSEIKAFKELNLKLTTNHKAIYAFLHLGYIPKKFTIYNEIKSLDPGSSLIYENSNIKINKYWNSNDYIKRNNNHDFESSKKKLCHLLNKSVEKRLISDVPIGTFLSGGTDSSLVTAIAQKINSKPINTFSIGFTELKYNESKYAKKVADYLKTNHHEFIISENQALDELENIMDHMDEPFADSSALPTMLVSKMAKKHVSVCLTGDGGDELFMGYGAYKWANRLQNPLIWRTKNTIGKLLSLSTNNKHKRAGLVFNSPKTNWKSHIFSQEQCLFSEDEIKKLLNIKTDSNIVDDINVLSQQSENLKPNEQQANFDFNNYLTNDLLVKVDRASMFSSLEARTPLLDHEIIELSLGLPLDFKIKKGISKIILKDILYDYVPKEIMDRPKWGFSIPLEKWLKTELKYLVDKYLNKEALYETKILNQSIVNNLIFRFHMGDNYLYNRIWSLIILQKFLLK